jgi:hypothetical protein
METLRQELEEERRKSASLEATLARQAGGVERGAERAACKGKQGASQLSETSFDADSCLPFEESAISYDPDRLMERTGSGCDDSMDNKSYLSSSEDTPRPGFFVPTHLCW